MLPFSVQLIFVVDSCGIRIPYRNASKSKSIKSAIAREGLNGIVVSVVSLSQANAGATWPSYCFPRAMAKGSACVSSSCCRRKIEKTYQSMSMSLLRPQTPRRSYEVQRGLRTFPRERQRKVLLVWVPCGRVRTVAAASCGKSCCTSRRRKEIQVGKNSQEWISNREEFRI